MKFFRAIVTTSTILLALIVAPYFAHAAVLETAYTPNTVFSNSVNGQTGFVTINASVTALTGQLPQNAILRYKTNVVGSTSIIEQPIFNPSSTGTFEQTLTGFACGQVYRFRLFEIPPPETTGATESLILYNGTPGFDHQISCGQAQSGGGDITTTFADATNIGGVNWGTLVSGDTTISINGAHLIPLAPTTVPKTFKIEWGFGTPGQANYNNVVNYSSPITANPPAYSFNYTIPGLAPNTDYYITLLEYVADDGTGESGFFNLFTYGFAPTNLMTGNDTHHLFETPTNLKIYGHLASQNGAVIYNQPIKISLRNMSGTELWAAETITSSASGGGYFEHTFTSITGAPGNMVPGQQYQFVILNNDSIPETGSEITVPQMFTVPVPNTNTGGSTATTAGTPDYNGLVTCGLDPNNYDCDFNSFLSTVNRVVNFLIMFIAFPVIALAIAWAGILLIVTGGSSSSQTKAKAILWDAIIGLVVALLAWVIIKLVLIVFGYTPSGPLWAILGTTPPQ